MNEHHTPNPEFVNRLEWELKSTVRRKESLNGTSSAMRPVGFRLGAILALVVLSMFVGGAGTYAVTHRADEETAALYIARGEALLEIAQTRLDHMARELARTDDLVQHGAVAEREWRQIEAQFSHAEAEAEVRKLELAETLITGKEPNNALSAPLVEGRDFVTERMAAQRRPLQLRLELVMGQERRHQVLVDTGRATARELKAAQTQVAAAEEESNTLEERIALRASFLVGELSAADVELQGMRFGALAARVMAVRQVELLAAEHQRVADLSERGLASHAELRAVEAALDTVEAQVKLADLELRILDQKLDDAPEE